MHAKCRQLLAVAATLALVAPCVLAQDDFGGWAGDPNSEPDASETLLERSDSGNVAQAAQFSYAAGVRELKSAAKMKEKLGQLEGKKLEAMEEKIAKAYERATQSFQDAIQTNPKMVEAYGGLSQALLASGKYAESLQVSSRGLKLAPGDDELFAGWAESIMALDMLGDATQAYMQLRGSSPERAEMLMGVMKGWLVEHQADPGGLAPEAITRLEQWINEQESTG